MGVYLNPGNDGFKRILNGEYVDKTGLIELVNKTIDTADSLTCISRPRRFGKSYAAQMLCAYYDNTCDSHVLFDGLKIAESDTYERYINKYHVIYLDITSFTSESKRKGEPLQEVPQKIYNALSVEISAMYPKIGYDMELSDMIIELVEATDRKVVFIIDEWDSMIRETAQDQEAQERYLNLLRSWFKNGNFTPKVIAAAYITGILPIKKDGTQSAISDFCEYTMLEPQGFRDYVGFTENEVLNKCRELGRSFESMKNWYDGYTVGDAESVYNPYSVMLALKTGKYKSYWKKTSAAETLMTYIDMDQEGLQDDIARMIAGESIEVSTDLFQNDVETFNSKDDVLTLLIHLGYLTYEEIADSYDGDGSKVAGIVKIPNEEVRTEFEIILRKAKHKALVSLIRRSDKLLQDTIAGNNEAVAEAIQRVHDSEYAPTFYNDEQSLRYVVKLAYLSCVDQYSKIEEMPSGRGIADVVFVPKRRSSLPAMIVELKWDKTSEGAISQVKTKKYPEALSQYGGEIVLVGINYDTVSKGHSCTIEFYK